MRFLWQLFLVALATASPATERGSINGCKTLASKFQGRVYYPDSTTYANETTGLFARMLL